MEEKSNARVQWEKLKGQPFSEKLRYVLEYYGIFVGIGAAIIVLILILFLTSGSSGLKHVASGVLYNLDYEGSTTPISDVICEKCGYDKEKCDVEFQTVMLSADDPVALYEQQEAVYGRIVSGDLDFLCGTLLYMNNYLSDKTLDECDMLMLNEILPQSLIEKLDAAGRVYYYDTEFSGHTAFFIDISDSYITEALKAKTQQYYLGIACQTKNKAALIAMIEALVE